MDYKKDYGIIQSWEGWLKNQPFLKSLLTHAENKDWDKSAEVLTQLSESNRTGKICIGKEFFRYHAIFYIIEGIDELTKHTEYVSQRCKASAPGLFTLLGHRYHDENNLIFMEKYYLKSLKELQCMPASTGVDNLGLSTYFYLSSYVIDDDRAEQYMCDLIEKYYRKVSHRTRTNRYEHKIMCPAIWLTYFGKTERAQSVLKKIPYIKEFSKERAIKWLEWNNLQSSNPSNKWRLPRNGNVAQGPYDLPKVSGVDVTWGWVPRYREAKSQL
jgi:hypothetical protein